MTNIGCESLIQVGRYGLFVGLECAKGRGIVLPGGTWEGPHETFKECAARELKEETGLTACFQRYLFGGYSTDDYFVYTFWTGTASTGTLDMYKFTSPEGKVVLAKWGDLLKSAFKARYEILYDVWSSKR